MALTLAGLLLGLPATPASAQRLSDEQIAVLRTALPHVRAALPSGVAVLDPELFCAPRLLGWDCPSDLRSEASRLGLTLHGRAFTLVCPGSPARCRLVGAESLLVFQPPRLDGDDATVRVDIWRRGTSPGRPVARRSQVLRLQRERGQWRVMGEGE